ncbi:MAG: hypothetical protein ACK47C_02795 [Paracoccaceae bacterium]
MRLTLHVGLPKTATTTIQHVLEAVKPQLAERGIVYPGSTAEHLGLVRQVQSGRVEDAARTIDAMAEEARDAGAEHLLLSCEHMSLMPERAVANLKALFEARLPGLRELRVLAYVREPIGFATSLCQQRLKSGTTRLAAFRADPWPLRPLALIMKQVRTYGRDAVHLRYLHPEHLVGGTVADDIFAAIGLEGLRPPDPVPILNPSLSHQGAMVADALAALVPRDQRNKLQRRVFKRRLEAITGEKFVLPEAVQTAIIEASRRDLEGIRSLFGLEITPMPVAEIEVRGFDDAMAEAMARDILASAATQPGDRADRTDEVR